MLSRVLNPLLLLAFLLPALSCGRGGNGGAAPQAAEPRSFPMVRIPAAIGDVADRQAYLTEHYWDAFFEGGGPSDSALILGVPKGEVEQAFSNFTVLLSALPLEESDRMMHGLFNDVCRVQAAEPSSLFYRLFGEIVSGYLYDPNSPLRDEDLYLPYVQDMAASGFSREDMLPAYRYEAESCSINRRGSVAPDFSIADLKGRRFSLHSLKAQRTLLFFSNPGCRNCREIGEALMSDAVLVQMMRDGRLAVVNVYIDEDFSEWKKYARGYPALWHSGYDAAHAVRGKRLYDVRAIPSLYLLDAQKRVLLKDAPLEKVINALTGQGNA